MSDDTKTPIDLDLTNSRNPDEPVFTKQSAMNEASDISQKISQKLNLINQVKKLSSGDWLITQEILQDIQANLLSQDPQAKMPSVPKQLEMLKTEIETRYKEDEETKTLLLNSLPTSQRIKVWLNLENWNDAVWSKIRNCHLFNKENRYKVIDKLMAKALNGDVMAAKIWLTLSGDYSDKMDLNTDKRIEAYREINEILHNKKNSQ